MRRIGGRLRFSVFGRSGVNGEIPPFVYEDSNLDPLPGLRTVVDGQFNWGGSLLKSNGGVLRCVQHGWQSCVECKGINALNCERKISSRYESRA